MSIISAKGLIPPESREFESHRRRFFFCFFLARWCARAPPTFSAEQGQHRGSLDRCRGGGGGSSLRPGRGARRVLELVEARLEAGEARLADAARRPLLVDEARLDEDVAAARRCQSVAEAGRL